MATKGPNSSPWSVVGQAAAALAVGMGVGRFAYTPILPLMITQAHLSQQAAGLIATANYFGYLLGAIAVIILPRLLESTFTLRTSLVVLTVTLARMPLADNVTDWLLLRMVAGVASALIFIIAASSMFTRLHEYGSHLIGWGFGGVGAGIAASGLLVSLLRDLSNWGTAWIASAALAAIFSTLCWTLTTRPPVSTTTVTPTPTHPGPLLWFVLILISYSLEGVGYIVAGTFLVAAIDQSAPGLIGADAWTLVGLAALPSTAFWAWLAYRFSRATLLVAALVAQAIGIALPALFAGAVPALISAFLFGATFLGIATLALGIGSHLQFPRAIALLTTGYSVGQILGPLIVTPFVSHGYREALLLGAAAVVAAAAAAGALRMKAPDA
ncbi:YbfB/YjiJ family MFS transporter [Arthrobacter sp. B2a2-09]|uniref:YbfB/YjiJ family MFS transporter n=1 Tax=Arthrobacter sp. B2a2-09 TaxID=2952822 RepID=UPI0022CD6B22|nr:YbfB/YjiJ family MFS transporter [Arthrobacter sp. B2a2-09]MCZ9880340.1 YbfB/YjiJ family MFS transporter [Arthrobacter sp. B2a2-09]